MLYWHVFDKTSREFYDILCVFVNFAGFYGFTWISRLGPYKISESLLSIGNQMISSAIWNINKHKENFSKTNKSVQARRASVHFVVFEKFTSVLYLFQIAREKSCDYLHLY